MKNLFGKVAVVTGASKGIGATLAQQLASQGVNVALLARSRERLTQVERALTHHNVRAVGIPTDITSWEQVQDALNKIQSTFGTVDYLVNNAGLAHWNPIIECTEDQWDDMMNLNLKGMFFCTKAFAPIMIANQSGHIINISSSLGKHAAAGFSVYSATKFAVTGFSEAVQLELKPYGIKVTTIYPGIVDTEFRDHQTNRPKGTRLDTSKMLSADDVAEAIVYVMKTADTATPSELVVNAVL